MLFTHIENADFQVLISSSTLYGIEVPNPLYLTVKRRIYYVMLGRKSTLHAYLYTVLL